VFASVARNGNLRRLESAWALSNLASRASAVAVAVYAYEADGVGAVGVIAFLRLALAAGASPWLALAADRRSRRLVLIVSDLMRCAMLGAMAGLVAYGATSAVVYALAVLVAVAEPVFRSAQAAFTPSLVEAPEELTAANVIASGVESVGLFAGPALGALLLSVAGTDTVFAVTAAVLLATVLLLARIDVAGEPGPEPSDSRREAILAGWHAIASTPALRVIVGLISVQTLVAGLLNVLIVVLALELLDLGTAGVGWLNGVLGLGATLGALGVAGIAGSRRLSGYFTVGLLLWGVPLLLVAAWPHAAPAFVLLALVGIGNTLVDVTGITLMQRAASNAVLSRVFGAFEALALLAMGIGALVAPLLVSELGARGAVLVAGSILPLAIVPLLGTLTRVDAVAIRPSRERLELLRAIPIFAPLPARLLERLAAAAVEVFVEEGSVVFEEDAAGDRFFVIEEGRATVESRSAIVRELGSGDFFGEIALLRDVPRTATVRALTPLRLLALDRSTFIDTVTGHATSGEAAGAVVAARLRAPVGS
jgi:MFS family permease